MEEELDRFIEEDLEDVVEEAAAQAADILERKGIEVYEEAPKYVETVENLEGGTTSELFPLTGSVRLSKSGLREELQGKEDLSSNCKELLANEVFIHEFIHMEDYENFTTSGRAVRGVKERNPVKFLKNFYVVVFNPIKYKSELERVHYYSEPFAYFFSMTFDSEDLETQQGREKLKQNVLNSFYSLDYGSKKNYENTREYEKIMEPFRDLFSLYEEGGIEEVINFRNRGYRRFNQQ